MITCNTIVRFNFRISENKVYRWQKISLSAVKQSGGARSPLINLPLEFSEAVKKLNPAPLFEVLTRFPSRSFGTPDGDLSGQRCGVNLIFWEKEKKKSLKEIFSTFNLEFSTINLFIDPKSGFIKKK